MSDHRIIPIALLYQRMADNKKGRDKQADDEERRQRERELEEARDRADEAEPGATLGNLDETLENHNYPTTTDELIEAYGDREVESQGGSKSINELLASNDDETYDSPDEVRNRIQKLLNRR